MHRLYILIPALALLFSSCATEQYANSINATRPGSGDKLPPELRARPGKAKIVVLRKKNLFVGIASQYKVYDGAHMIGRLGNGGMLIWDTDPKFTQIRTVLGNPRNYSLIAQSEQTYFFAAEIDWSDTSPTNGYAASYLIPLDPADGVAMYERLKK